MLTLTPNRIERTPSTIARAAPRRGDYTALIRGCFESADYAEGRTAFMQKRKPAFTGR